MPEPRAEPTAPDFAVLAAGSPWSVEQWSQAWVITVDAWDDPDDVPKVWQAVLNMCFAMTLSFHPAGIARSFAEVKVLYDHERAGTRSQDSSRDWTDYASGTVGPNSDAQDPSS